MNQFGGELSLFAINLVIVGIVIIISAALVVYAYKKVHEITEERNDYLSNNEKINQKNLEMSTLLLDEKKELVARETAIEEKEIQLKKKYKEKLLELANLTEEEALTKLLNEVRYDNAKQLERENEYWRKESKKRKTEIFKEIALDSIESAEIEMINSSFVNTIEIPNETIKGKLIGKTGKTIRSLEEILNVNVIIDDTPGEIYISSFNTKKRNIARLVIEDLVKTSQITTQKIIEKKKIYTEELENEILEIGYKTIDEFRITKIEEPLVQLIGELSQRSSYGQNALNHSIEVAKISQNIAKNLKLDQIKAARAGLLHDIGKVSSHNSFKSHVELGIEYAKEYNEEAIIINTIASHHGDVLVNNEYAIIVAFADKISASRLGARTEKMNLYIERVEKLEEIALNHPEVYNAFAVLGGREIRILADANKCEDAKIEILAEEIRAEIEREIDFPGIIDVVVTREWKVAKKARKGQKNE